MSYLQGDKPITITKLLAMHADGEKIAVLTAYDSTMSALLNRCGVEVILIGDSLGNVIQGHSSTTPVTVEEMAYHTECVARANHHAFLVADLPFASYGDPVQALESAAELMRAGADMVKLEGGSWQIDIIRFLVERSVPVCAHLGLLPQSVHLLGGYKVQGKSKDAATQMLDQAHDCQAAGAQMLVLEAIPSVRRLGLGQGPTVPDKFWFCRIYLELAPVNPQNLLRTLWPATAPLRQPLKLMFAKSSPESFLDPNTALPLN
jgi:3-methyl-2-oxobutanoate hydroxymethyltransferase